MKHVYNCSAFVGTISNNQDFVNKQIIATSVEEAQQKFNEVLKNKNILAVDSESVSVKLKA